MMVASPRQLKTKKLRMLAKTLKRVVLLRKQLRRHQKLCLALNAANLLEVEPFDLGDNLIVVPSAIACEGKTRER